MKNKLQLPLLALLSILFTNHLSAEIKLPAIVSSNMVLQRNTTVILWGWADASEKISIEASWINGPIHTLADGEGKWWAEVKTSGSKEPQTISLKGNDSEITLDDVLFGEVWLCSGQSNMEQSLKGYNGEPTYGGLETVARSANPDLRLFTANRKGSKEPLEDVAEFIGWQSAGPGSVRDFSAVAYFFGQQLQEILDVPVGMIHTSWGGSSVQAWISKEVIGTYMEVDLEEVDITNRTNHIPTAL